MKRHNFKGQGASHGNHKHHRAPGSIGSCSFPGRVFKGLKMSGQMGHEQVTTLNLEVVESDAERNVLLVAGLGSRPQRRRDLGAQRRQVSKLEGSVIAMAQITLKNAAGKDAGKVDLDDATFGIQPNVPVMHQVVTAQLAARRAGTQSTKTRAEVRGGGAKPYRQKGTGNARQGSIRSPQFSGGGVALGPKPRKYDQKTPKKMISLALRSALSDRANEGKVIVVDSWGWDKPSTKAAMKALAGLGIEGRVLVVVGRDDAAAALSFRNLPEVQLIAPGELNAYDVLCNDWIVFTQDVLPTFEGSVKPDAEAEAETVAADEDAEVAEEIEADEEAVEARRGRGADELEVADDEAGLDDPYGAGRTSSPTTPSPRASPSRATPTRCCTTRPTALLRPHQRRGVVRHRGRRRGGRLLEARFQKDDD